MKKRKQQNLRKNLILEQFHQWIHIFRKKASERMLIKKLWDHTIEVKEGFVLKKKKVYPLSREEREDIYEFIEEKLRKEYIRPSKSSQMAPVFIVGKKNE